MQESNKGLTIIDSTNGKEYYLGRKQTLKYLKEEMSKSKPVWDEFTSIIPGEKYVCKKCGSVVIYKSVLSLIFHHCKFR